MIFELRAACGQAGGAGPLSRADAAHYGQVMAANADELFRQVRPGDIVLLHDPQTAGLASRHRRIASTPAAS